MKAIDLTGQKFGKLAAVEVIYTDNIRKWLCKCDCGGELKATAGELRGGRFKSCGCLAHTDLSAIKKQNLQGRKFGKLTVIKSVSKTKWGWDVWLCICDCGKQTEAKGRQLVQGNVHSCGCLRGIDARHGDCRNHRETDTYRLWHRIKERCSNPNRDYAERYFLRGIRVCDEWSNSYETFKAWALSHGYKKGLQIDRINSDGNYEPNNCRFVSPAENTRNQAQVKLNHEKVSMIRELLREGILTHAEIGIKFGVSRSTIGAINSGKLWGAL